MSSIVIYGDTSGSIALQANAVAGTNTLTIPAKTGALLTNVSTGTVLQVVNATYSTLTSSTSASFADSGLSASITPSSASNKILCIVDINGCAAYTTTSALGLQLVRGATTILGFESVAAYVPSISSNGSIGSSSTNYLDSPATTSSTTYKVQLARTSGSGTVYINNYINANGTYSTLTLMEIAG